MCTNVAPGESQSLQTRTVTVAALLIALVLCAPVQAHMWNNLAASGAAGEFLKSALPNLYTAAGRMTPDQRAEPQRLARMASIEVLTTNRAPAVTASHLSSEYT